jgi:hypothetical protein
MTATERWRRYYASHREQEKQRRVVYRRDHFEEGILSRAKHRAKTLGVPFSLTIADIVVPSHCPVLGIPIIFNHGRKGYFPNSVSIDRIVPSLGYVPSNIRIISARANLLKNDATAEELRSVLYYLETSREKSHEHSLI